MARFDGTEGRDLLPGGVLGPVLALGDDTFFGKGGDDVIIGYAGNDSINGGQGADVIIGGTLSIVANVGAVDVSGQDAASYAGSAAGVSVDLSTTSDLVLDLPLSGRGFVTVGLAGASMGHGGDAEGDVLVGITNLVGSSFLDVLTGNDADNYIFGGGGNDVLRGGGGNDILNGHTGIDTMFGGVGNDVFYIDSAADQVREEAGEGRDTVLSSVSFTLRAGSEIERLGVRDPLDNAAINLTGNDFGQTITGNAGANILNGRGGADRMIGGAGNDRYYVDTQSDTVTEAAGGGTDQVIASTSYTLRAGVAVETLSTTGGASAINLTGNDFAQAVFGNDGANKLNALGGNDTLSGMAGNDTLYGGTGNDRLIGGAGNDTFVFNTALDAAANLDTISDFANAGGNNDRFVLDDAFFAGLNAGGLGAGFFAASATGAAADASDVILYNTQTGALSFDADGNGAGAAIQFATLASKAALTAADFVVI